MTQRDARAYLQDIIDCARVIHDYVAGRTFEDYERSMMMQDAVERRLAIMGEALNRALQLDSSLESRIRDVRQVIAFRNRLVHVYTDIDSNVVWEVVHDHVPSLAGDVERVLRESGT